MYFAWNLGYCAEAACDRLFEQAKIIRTYMGVMTANADQGQVRIQVYNYTGIDIDDDQQLQDVICKLLGR